jgi:hypothetical protein
MIRLLSVFIGVLGLFNIAHAGQLVTGATVLEVANTNTGDASFAVRIEGGSGICTGTSPHWIVFPDSRKASSASYSQAFAIALAAIASEKKVRIHNFIDDSCAGASFISIVR